MRNCGVILTCRFASGKGFPMKCVTQFLFANSLISGWNLVLKSRSQLACAGQAQPSPAAGL
ncbi:MAG: hypothetical protein DBW88_12945 [Pseudomonas sp.]|jgi:hypothetical protein|nr:hypothetical protein AYK87_11575 [Stutzerimonas stutzeri]RCL56026.1 MAG: hypothetical protein DBW88_12945 [Pseudomonas sp.]RRW54708.1 hypothetical protein EGJ42_04765 [Stutzerimonas stutzeri]